mmetsp:Transcript_11085/g.34242  ORF Transcript_11085/g.34242 Transcript_11085/m.34242 type:complete len:263 (+) Transcript_11085:160-948(+)
MTSLTTRRLRSRHSLRMPRSSTALASSSPSHRPPCLPSASTSLRPTRHSVSTCPPLSSANSSRTLSSLSCPMLTSSSAMRARQPSLEKPWDGARTSRRWPSRPQRCQRSRVLVLVSSSSHRARIRPSSRLAAAYRSSTSNYSLRRLSSTPTVLATPLSAASSPSSRRRPTSRSAFAPAIGLHARLSRSRVARSPRARAPTPKRVARFGSDVGCAVGAYGRPLASSLPGAVVATPYAPTLGWPSLALPFGGTIVGLSLVYHAV